MSKVGTFPHMRLPGESWLPHNLKNSFCCLPSCPPSGREYSTIQWGTDINSIIHLPPHLILSSTTRHILQQHVVLSILQSQHVIQMGPNHTVMFRQTSQTSNHRLHLAKGLSTTYRLQSNTRPHCLPCSWRTFLSLLLAHVSACSLFCKSLHR